MFKIFKNKKLLFKWSVSYLVLLCITIIVNISAYMIVEKRIVDMNNKNATTVLKQRKQSIDGLKSSLLNIAYGISQDTNVRALAFDTKEINAGNRMEFFNLMEKTKSYFGMNTYFPNVFIYFNKLDYITSAQGIASSEQYYDFYCTDKNMNKNEWYSALTSNHFGEFIDFSDKGEEPGKGDILFLYSVYGNERFKPYATIAIKVEYSELFSEDLEDDLGRMFFITDKNQNIIAADRNTDMEYVENFLKDNEIKEGITDYGNFVTVAEPSDSEGWLYINIITKKAFRKSINDSRMIIIICNFLCVGILSWLAFRLSNRNYRPIREIIDTLNGGNDNVEGGEFRYIDSKISEILLENEYISKKTQKQNEMLRDMFFLKMLTNNSLPKNKDKIFDELEIFFPYENFLCVLFCIDFNADMFYDNQNVDVDTAYQLAKVVITNVLDEKLDENCFRYYCDMNNTLCMITNISGCDRREEIYNVICKIHSVVLKNFNIKFVSGISAVHTSSDNVHVCYKEAKLCVDYRFFENRDIIKYEEVVAAETAGYYYPHVQEERLIRTIKICDVDSSLNLLDEIFNKNFKEHKISVQQARHFLLAIVLTIEENFGLNTEGIDDVREMVKSMENDESLLSEIKQRIYTIVICICRNRDNDKNSRIKDMVEQVKNYISNNYSDPDLNVNTVAQKFNITSSYMSTIFKKNTQIGLQKYIVSIRMEHAKNILSITNYTIDKVAVMVGYVNSRSFTRAFSKNVGMSPGKYKERTQNI